MCYSNKVITKIFYGTSSSYICSTPIFVLGSPPYFSCYFFPRGASPPPLPPAWVDSGLPFSLKNMPYFVQFPTRSETHEYVLIDVFGWINYIFSFDNHYNHLLSGHSGKSCFYNCSSWLSLTLHIDPLLFLISIKHICVYFRYYNTCLRCQVGDVLIKLMK